MGAGEGGGRSTGGAGEVVRKSSWVRFYLRRHVQAVEGDKTMSLLVNAKTGNVLPEYHPPYPPPASGRGATCHPGWVQAHV